MYVMNCIIVILSSRLGWQWYGCPAMQKDDAREYLIPEAEKGEYIMVKVKYSVYLR